MRILYVNNFRGFQQTIIPIAKVNFLVGENSSGKTSILKLIKLLSDEQFKYSLDFSSPIIDLGRFEDIVNKTESSGKFFEIGMMVLAETDESGYYQVENDYPYYIKFTYKEINEKIKLAEIRFQTPNYDSYVVLKDGAYEYVYKEIKEKDKPTSESNLPLDFYNWCSLDSPLLTRKNFKKSKEASPFYMDYPRFYLREIFSNIRESIDKKNKFNKSHNRLGHDFNFVIDNLFPRIKWIAPIRAEPKRIYEHMETKESIDGSHAPQVLRDILLGSNKKTLLNFKRFLDKFGKNSHLFDEIRVKKFGNEKFAPFEIQIILEGKPFSISSVGYGVSQVLPLLLEIFDVNNTWLAIQQPEVHLHPRAQAEFGELLYNSALETEKVFFIETHSDFTIDRFRYCINLNPKKMIESQVLFFNRNSKRNQLEVIPINTDGSYYNSEDPQFRDFFINESVKLLGI